MKYRIKETYNGYWIVQYRAYLLWVNYSRHASYEQAKIAIQKLIDEEAFKPRIFYPPLPDKVEKRNGS